MLHSASRTASCSAGPSRAIHSSQPRKALKQLETQRRHVPVYTPKRPIPPTSLKGKEPARSADVEEKDEVKRNEVGVQLLSRKLHRQLFKGVSFPPPDQRYIRLAREHLRAHGLDPTQGSELPDAGFTLPQLRGSSIDEHFFRIGHEASEPWLSLANEFSSINLPPKPEFWHLHSGWTKYHFREDGSSYYEQVRAPDEDVLSFDVETMPNVHQYPIMACAVSKSHWYSWLSPWLLGETEDSQHFIPFGDPAKHRLVVGHNVSYDRARILEEYSVEGTNTRFLDTMSLHVAVKGISSHQRPAWMKYRKSKNDAKTRKEEAIEAAKDLLQETQEKHRIEADISRRAELKRLQQEIEESLPQLTDESWESADAEASSKRWEDITSANSLADVAKLHCGIEMEKGIRDDFMTRTREDIRESLEDYMDYCASDVASTHAVYAKVFPEFLLACPSPVSFAGVLRMGSSFLTVNESWEEYLRNAEEKYQELTEKIKLQLVALADDAKNLIDDREKWETDPWLRQLDWTPKVAGKSRGVEALPMNAPEDALESEPRWYKAIQKSGVFHQSVVNHTLPLLLQARCDGQPLTYDSAKGWTYMNDKGKESKAFDRQATVHKLLGKSVGKANFEKGRLSFSNMEIGKALVEGDESQSLAKRIMQLASDALDKETKASGDHWLAQLNWEHAKVVGKCKEPSASPVRWPKWYWDLAKPKKGAPPGTLDLTIRNRFAPLLLKLSWSGNPLVFSREHGWVFRVESGESFETRQQKLTFYDPADSALQEESLYFGTSFYKLPHKDGESANVGSPFGKSFLKYAQDGTLASPGGDTKEALDMNAQCSYWISSRDRIVNQMVVWGSDKVKLGASSTSETGKLGMILPQVITMGAVTRRAIEKTWLTASNAKKNRVGSELKAMVRAPKGYAIVGADVDSEELWISSAMGDAQFGLHGATALGWMTLEGTKSAGTDLHSKTASILGISRDQAKVFNYSRIYGAGMRHAILLLLQSNPGMLPDVAKQQAEKLYASTKGKNTHRTDVFGRKFWFGGSESYVFNKLEEIATSDRPLTPALGCGVTYALSKEYLPPGFGTDYMTSRINWVVQSSGVDYLHLLIVAMEYLCKAYDIKARYLISVHDELRYLVKEEDRYRAALALQIANLWTRCLFAYKLGMDDLPQGVAFFSAVDVDHVLRKEVDLPCVTPSQPNPIVPGESLNIAKVLEKTNGGSLYRDGRPMDQHSDSKWLTSPSNCYVAPNCLAHRASSPYFLRAQAAADFGEVKRLGELESGKTFQGDIGGPKTKRKGQTGNGSNGSNGGRGTKSTVRAGYANDKKNVTSSGHSTWNADSKAGAYDKSSATPPSSQTWLDAEAERYLQSDNSRFV